MNKKLIIFDCDGVLVDSEVIAHQIVVNELKHFGINLELEESIKEFTGVNGKKSQEIFLEKYGIHITDAFWQQAQSQILSAFELQLRSLNGKVLSFLSDGNVALAVASSSPRDRVLRALSLTGQLGYFSPQAIFTSQQVKRGKPAPDLFLYAAHQQGYLPEECIVVEDSPAGVQAALAANMEVIGFLGGSHAHYPWYSQQLKRYSIPLAYNEKELLSFFS